MLVEKGDTFRETMNTVIRGYCEAWVYFNDIPTVDNIVDEITNIAEENITALCYEENADNPAFWPVYDENDDEARENAEEERDSVIRDYMDQYYQTGHEELEKGIDFLLGELKLTYYGYEEGYENREECIVNKEVLRNPAQNILFDFNYLGVFYE